MTLDSLSLLDAMDAAADLLRNADPNYPPADDQLVFRRLQKQRMPGLDREQFQTLFAEWQDRYAAKAVQDRKRGNIIERFCRETDKDGQVYGDKSAVTMKPRHIEKIMEARADKPDSANGLRKVLREMIKVAVKTLGVKKIKPKKKGGFHRWTDEIAKFEDRHAVGTRARLAMTLGSTPGRRRMPS